MQPHFVQNAALESRVGDVLLVFVVFGSQTCSEVATAFLERENLRPPRQDLSDTPHHGP